MRFVGGRLSATPTDLANFLACRHKTALDLLVAGGRLSRPTWVDPLADVLRQRGEDHQRPYVGALGDDRWLGYADVLRKVNVPSATLGAWSYEAHDTKLSRETRGGTILQLCVYSELLGEIQGHTPEFFHVITPSSRETYRVDDF